MTDFSIGKFVPESQICRLWKGYHVKMTKISVVTVCYNAQDTIEKTIKSVVEQDDTDFEYLIQDGVSSDRTTDIVAKYQKQYEIKLVSEKDQGLYDAMNKAVKRSTGEYILFLNSGDVFCDRQVLSRMAASLEGDIVMGNVIRLTTDGEVKEGYAGRHTVFKLLLSGRMPCHQVIFAKRKLLLEMAFDLSYSICADFDFMVRCVKSGCSMKYVDLDVSYVDCIEGISSQADNLWEMRRQDDRSLKASFPVWYQLMRPIKYIKRKLIG